MFKVLFLRKYCKNVIGIAFAWSCLGEFALNQLLRIFIYEEPSKQ
jgi:hypothetical protein